MRTVRKYSDIRGSDFYSDLRRRLEENRKLYRDGSPFVVFNTPFGKFVASYLGVNPWKVLVPLSFLVVIGLRLIIGAGFSEIVLRILGGE